MQGAQVLVSQGFLPCPNVRCQTVREEASPHPPPTPHMVGCGLPGHPVDQEM